MFRVKEVFYTLQGEGLNAGRPAVFLRFSGCNLWSGREEDRERGPSCSHWCDTDFLGINGLFGGEYAEDDLARLVQDRWPGGGKPLVVCTGGEPLLQLTGGLVENFRGRGWEVAVETNGTIGLDRLDGVRPDHVCVSPKAGAKIRLREGDELKVVWPQAGFTTADLEEFLGWPFRHFFLQPLDDIRQPSNTRECVAHCLADPRWRISCQLHKTLGLP